MAEDLLPKLTIKSGLDPRFDWNESLDENHIFEEERQMILELRERLKHVLDGRGEFSDKILCIFLIGRKHNLERTEKMLRAHFDWRDEHGWRRQEDVPKLKDVDLEFFQSGAAYEPDGCFDKWGRMLGYRFVANMNPKYIESFATIKPLLIWSFYHRVQVESLRHWRAGMVVVNDFKGLKMSKMGMNKEMNKLQDIFPMRIRQLYVVNSGWFITPLLKLLRFVIKAKVIQRLLPVKESDLQHVIDPEFLPTQYGGKLEIDIEGLLANVKAKDKELRRSHKKHHRHDNHHSKTHESSTKTNTNGFTDGTDATPTVNEGGEVVKKARKTKTPKEEKFDDTGDVY